MFPEVIGFGWDWYNISFLGLNLCGGPGCKLFGLGGLLRFGFWGCLVWVPVFWFGCFAGFLGLVTSCGLV